MLTPQQIRKKYAPASPCDVLDDLFMVISHPKKENFHAPVLTVVMISGNTFRAYLINTNPPDSAERVYMFALERENAGDGASDLIYVQGHRIESVSVWNIEDYSGILPRLKDKAPPAP